ncbi:chondroitinase family polysaccharide lyase [Phocaeicola sp.]
MKKHLIPLLCIYATLFCFSAAHAQKYNFERKIPQEIVPSAGSRITLSSTYYKEGDTSLEWKYAPHSSLTIGREVSMNEQQEQKYGITLWIYNEVSQSDSLVFQFLDAKGEVQYHFSYQLQAIGWRACWIGFHYMKGKKQDRELKQCRIIAPSRKGRIFMDRLILPQEKMNDRTTPDEQIPYNNSLANRDLWHWCRVWQWEQYRYALPLKGKLPAEDINNLLTIERRLTDYCRQSLNKSHVQKAFALYEKCNIKRSGKGYTGAPIVAPDELDRKKNEITWQDVEIMLSGFAYAYIFHQNKEAKMNYFKVFDYAIDQGFAYGSGMGTNHHYGYQTRQIYLSAWLMRNDIYQYANKEAILDMLRFWAALQETRLPCQKGRDELLDSWHTLLMPKLISAMLFQDEKEKDRALLSLSVWLSTSLVYTPGTIGGIKVDGTTFHHGGFYPAYTTGALGMIGNFIRLTLDTSYGLEQSSREVFKHALQSMRNYTNLHEWSSSLGGRHPFGGGMKEDDIEAFGALALAGDLSGKGEGIDRELAADYIRLQLEDTPLKRKFQSQGILPAAAPQGFFVYNYGSAGVYRQKNWMVTLKGYTTDVWGAEIYTKDNRYGRYQSYGSVLIQGDGNPVSRQGSGFSEDGWDWNRLPGTTTIHLPFDLLDSPLKGTTMAHSKENFSGSTSFNKGVCGLFAMKLMERGLKNFTADFVARKSVSCFDNRLICLGSGIHNSNRNHPTETTLFQCAIGGSSYIPAYQEGDSVLCDPFHTYYYIRKGNIRYTEGIQHSFHNKTRQPTSGRFVTAWLDHGIAPCNASYEYLVLIKPTPKEQAEALHTYRILQHDNKAHIIYDVPSGTVACAFFDEFTGNEDFLIKYADAETLVMYRQEQGTVRISVCSPDLNIAEKTFTTSAPSRPKVKRIVLPGSWDVEQGSSHSISVRAVEAGTEVSVICRDGQPQEFILIRRK